MPVDEEQLHAFNLAERSRFPILMLLILILLMIVCVSDAGQKIRIMIKSMSKKFCDNEPVAIRLIREYKKRNARSMDGAGRREGIWPRR